MKTICVLALGIAAAAAARADFSYTMTMKGGMGPAAGHVTHQFIQGDKMKVESGETAMIFDFGAQTLTSINNHEKTYSVTPFSQLGGGQGPANVDVKVDVRETRQHRTISGYPCREVVLTVEMSNPESERAGMKSRITMNLWISPDVPGYPELRAFYQRVGDRFPWAAMAGGRGNDRMRQAMADLQKKMANLNGVPVLSIMKIGMAGSPARMAQQQEEMAKAREQLEAMKARGGPQAEAAERALAMMGGAGASPGTMMETRMESSGFSTAPIPASVFAPPAGYRETGHR
jgi:hypothetical protein